MQVNYPVGDFLIRVKNAAMSGRRRVVVRKTNLIEAVANELVNLGILKSVKTDKDGQMVAHLAYIGDEPAVIDIRLVSKPGLRIYMGADELEAIKKPSVFVISTPIGVVSSKVAIKKRVGGEVIAEIL